MIDVRPLTTRLRALAGRRRDWQDVAIRTVELTPATNTVSPPAIALPGEWERIEEFHPGADIGWEADVIRGGRSTQPPTLSYLVRDALIADGAVYAATAFEAVTDQRRRPFLLRDATRVEEAQFSTNWTIHNVFGHWLVDGLPCELLAEQRGLPALVIPKKNPWSHEAGYRAAAGLSVVAPEMVRCDSLWLVDDRHINEGRRARMRELRRRIRRADSDGPTHIFLDRGSWGKQRLLANRQAVVDVLRRQGFVEVHPEQETPERLIELMSAARLCVGVEGSAFGHAALLMPEGSTILALQPPRRFAAILKVWGESAGIGYAYLVGEQNGEGFDIDPSRLLRTIDLIERNPDGGHHSSRT